MTVCRDKNRLDLANAMQFTEYQSLPLFSGCKKGAIMMKCVSRWRRLFSLNDKGIAVCGENEDIICRFIIWITFLNSHIFRIPLAVLFLLFMKLRR